MSDLQKISATLDALYILRSKIAVLCIIDPELSHVEDDDLVYFKE